MVSKRELPAGDSKFGLCWDGKLRQRSKKGQVHCNGLNISFAVLLLSGWGRGGLRQKIGTVCFSADILYVQITEKQDRQADRHRRRQTTTLTN